MSLADLEKSMAEMEGLIDPSANYRSNRFDRPVEIDEWMDSPKSQRSNSDGGSSQQNMRSETNASAILQLKKKRNRNRAVLGVSIFILVAIFCAIKVDRMEITSAIGKQLGSLSNKEPSPPSVGDGAFAHPENSASEVQTNSTPLPEPASETPQEEELEPEIFDPVEDAKWGHWKFYDGDKASRPKEDYYSKYPNKDVKGAELPPNAWQADAVYVNHFLDEAAKLVHRAQEAIFEEYGHGQPRTPEQSVEAHKMFHISMINITIEGPPAASASQGGWSTERSFESLSKRLLHGMMTKDTFTVVMGGHSAAAGHGNLFKQSYMMQFHHVMEPVFEKLGMKLITRNMGQGGLGTMQNALGSQSIYGDEIDVILWDSHMTEGGNPDFDLFCRQALLGSKRAPFILGLGAEFATLQMLHEAAGADVGGLGSGMSGVPATVDEVQVNTLPWAVQFLNCVPERQDLCAANKYRTQCWVEREDVIPPTGQKAAAGGEAGWHPGFRSHQLTGRVLAFYILLALDEAIQKWSEITVTHGHPLADEHWHMTDYYEGIQKSIKVMPPSFCEQGSVDRYPTRLCTTSLKARTEYTPRVDPDKTSIVSILKPAPDGYIPSVPPPLYEGEDVPNPAMALPEGAIDVRSILSRGRAGRLLSAKGQTTSSYNTVTQMPVSHEINYSNNYQKVRRATEAISPGYGWNLHSEPSGFCDGSYYSTCGRQNSSDCLLRGHNDGRGGIQGDGLSGWLVMTLEGVKEGLIMMNVDYWHGGDARTVGWTEVNNGKQRFVREMESDEDVYPVKDPLEEEFEQHRKLGDYIPPAEGIVLEFSINGKITTWTRDELISHNKVVQRVVQWIVLLDDEEMAKSGKVETMEVAIRLNGCGRACNLSVNHVYWA